MIVYILTIGQEILRHQHASGQSQSCYLITHSKTRIALPTNTNTSPLRHILDEFVEEFNL